MKALQNFGRAAAFAALTIAAGSAAFAAQEAEQQIKPSLEKQIGDWTVLCFEKDGGSFCRMSETLVNKKTSMRVLSMGFRYFAAQKQSIMEIVVPLSVALQSGVVVDTDTYKSGALQYSICVTQGCQSLTPVEEDTIKKLRSATKGKVEVVDHGSGKKIAIAFPLNGFSEAYQTMVSASRPTTAASK